MLAVTCYTGVKNAGEWLKENRASIAVFISIHGMPHKISNPI